MRKKYRNSKPIRAWSAVERARSGICWGKKASKKYRGAAGKGGRTTNWEDNNAEQD